MRVRPDAVIRMALARDSASKETWGISHSFTREVLLCKDFPNIVVSNPLKKITAYRVAVRLTRCINLMSELGIVERAPEFDVTTLTDTEKKVERPFGYYWQTERGKRVIAAIKDDQCFRKAKLLYKKEIVGKVKKRSPMREQVKEQLRVFMACVLASKELLYTGESEITNY